MTGEVRNVLFLCTGNSARSILAEALLNRDGEGRFRAFSAGSDPVGAVHPLALELLVQRGISTSGLRSKAWDEFSEEGAPALDLIITVCDNAAGEACPVWPGRPVTAHWGLEDPAAAGHERRRAAFESAFLQLSERIAKLVALPLDGADAATLQARVRAIGSLEGAGADRG